ncbi:MAG: glycine-rich domain-containing protein [Opitutales bacterium]
MDLWNKLERFRVDAGEDSLTFIQRLARENAWELEFAERVYGEYLKFIYLACISSNPVTPSDEVDQVWHLHLCYSDSYWNHLCQGVLGRDLHHGPTKGGDQENQRYWEQYESTLNLYRDTFAHEAPRDVWPEASTRFDRKSRFVRVDLKDAFVVRKKTVFNAALFGVVSLLLVGCSQFFEDVKRGDPTSIVVLVCAIIFVIWVIKKISRGGPGGGWR